MKNIILFILLISLLLVIIFSVKQKINYKPLDNSQNQSLNISLDKKDYGLGEPISFTITNNTPNNIYYFPETCASNLVEVYVIQGDKPTLIQGEPKICMLAPSVETLLPEKSIVSKIPEKTSSKMSPGVYMIRFDYSNTKRDRFGLGELSVLDSETFKIVE